jgi:hypothetical protein
MKNKSILMILPTLIAVLLAVSFASALQLTLNSQPSITYSTASADVSFNLTNENTAFTASNIVIYGTSSIGTWSFSPAQIGAELASNSTRAITGTLALLPINLAQTITSTLNVNATINGTNQHFGPFSFSQIASIPSQPAFTITEVGSLSESINKTSFKIINTGNTALSGTISLTKIFDRNNKELVLTYPASFSISAPAQGTPGNSQIINVSYNQQISDFEFDIKSYPSTITVASSGINATATLNFEKSFCSMGTSGKVIVSEFTDTTSDNDFKWAPLDEVDIEVKVQNRLGDDADITVIMDLYDTINKEFIGLDGDGNELEDTVSVEDGRSETVTFSIKVPSEAVDSTSRYELIAKAYEDGNEDKACNQRSQRVEISRESRDVRLLDLVFPDSVSCGDSANINLKVANIGNNNEKKIKVEIVNSELGWLESKVVSSLAQDDSPAKVSFSLPVPTTAIEKDYTISFNVYYKYDSSDAVYDITKKAVASGKLKLQGNCIAPVNTQITAELITEAKAGNEAQIKATIKNIGNASSVYALSISGYESWASLDNVDANTFTLSSGQSKDVIITLTPNEDISGTQSLNINAVSNGVVKTQQISVSVTAGSGFNFSLFSSIKDNWFIWVIAIINIILIVAIIIVAVRILSK